jgi:hypothetical protein
MLSLLIGFLSLRGTKRRDKKSPSTYEVNVSRGRPEQILTGFCVSRFVERSGSQCGLCGAFVLCEEISSLHDIPESWFLVVSRAQRKQNISQFQVFRSLKTLAIHWCKGFSDEILFPTRLLSETVTGYRRAPLSIVEKISLLSFLACRAVKLQFNFRFSPERNTRKRLRRHKTASCNHLCKTIGPIAPIGR